MAASDLTAENVRYRLNYDPETGKFTWRRNWNSSLIGKETGFLNRDGYVRITIGAGQFQCFAHRLAWLVTHGKHPKGEIDHINGDRADNRICNLRDVSRQLNRQNQRAPNKNGSSGYLGVHSSKGTRKKWAARIKVGAEKAVLIGRFDDPLEAHKAYLKAKRKLHKGCTI